MSLYGKQSLYNQALEINMLNIVIMLLGILIKEGQHVS